MDREVTKEGESKWWCGLQEEEFLWIERSPRREWKSEGTTTNEFLGVGNFLGGVLGGFSGMPCFICRPPFRILTCVFWDVGGNESTR